MSGILGHVRGAEAHDIRDDAEGRPGGVDVRVPRHVLLIWGSGCRDQGSGSRVRGPGFRVQGSGFRVQGPGTRVQGPGFRVAKFLSQSWRA